MTVKGIDIYRRNSVPSLTDVSFIFHKVTQGLFFIDDQYGTRHIKYGKQVPLWGGYHFYSALNPVDSQLNAFIGHANLLPGEVAILDFEDWNNEWSATTPHSLANDANHFMMELKRRLPHNRCLLYCNRWTYTNIIAKYGVSVGDGLWIASPDGTPTMPYLFWQTGAINGIDMNIANFSTVDAMLRWAGKSVKGSGDEMGMTKVGKNIVLAVQGTDNELYLNFLNADGTPVAKPPKWIPTDKKLGSHPSIASRTGKDLWATWLDPADSSIVLAHNPDVSGSDVWDYQDLGGIGTGSPTLWADGDYVIIMVKGVKGELFLNTWSTKLTKWSGWQDLYGQSA